jgi:hypothetical protein
MVKVKISRNAKESFCRDWDKHIMEHGLFQQLKDAEQKRSELRKERCKELIYYPPGFRESANDAFRYVDNGLFYSKVWIEETE